MNQQTQLPVTYTPVAVHTITSQLMSSKSHFDAISSSFQTLKVFNRYLWKAGTHDICALATSSYKSGNVLLRLPNTVVTFVTQDTSNHRSTKHEFPSFGLLMATYLCKCGSKLCPW